MRVGGNFNCSCNNLRSLKGAPEYVGGDFDCSFNKIENINDLTTTYIGGDFYCYGNGVTDEDVRILKEKGIVKGEIYYKDTDDFKKQLFRGRKSVPAEEAANFLEAHTDFKRYDTDACVAAKGASKKIALIACSSTKLKESVKDKTAQFKAEDIYTGNTFKKSKDYCFDSENGTFRNGFDDFCILSAKYGLLEKDDMVSYYNTYLGKQSREYKAAWAKKVLAKLAEKYDLKNDVFYIFGGTSYYKDLLPHLGHYVVFNYISSNCIDLNSIKAQK